MWKPQNKAESKVYDLKEARLKIERFCAYQERSHKQVKEKLESFGLIADVVDELIFELIQSKFLNESRFAEIFVRSKFNVKGWGKIKITQHLKSHQVSEFNIKKGLQQINEGEYLEKFNEIASKKWSTLKGESTTQKKHKLIRFMLSRGFESQLCFDFINAIK